MKVFLNNIKKAFKNKNYLHMSIYVLVFLVILELTLFNYKFYTNMFNDEIDIRYIHTGSVTDTGNNTYKLGTGSKIFEINNINQHIKNICFDAEIVGDKEDISNKVVNIVISATDSGNVNYFDLPERGVVYDQTGTKYIPLNLNGDSYKIRVSITNCDNKTIRINKFTVNSKVPFTFNIARVILLFIIISVCYIIKPKSDFYKYVFNIKSKKQGIVFKIIVVLNLAVILSLGLLNPNNNINTVSHHHQYYWLADAILDGHFYLNDEPPDSLKNMSNPYDRKFRDEVMKKSGDTYKWDTAYYDGKYYVYFGIVPELLFYLPTSALGFLIVNKAPVIIMTMLAVIFGYLLMRELARRWFPNTSFLLYMMISVIFVNSTGALMTVKIPDLYMIPISHAYAFSLMGLFFWIKSLPYDDDGKLRGGLLFLGSLCMALVAGCRPQVVLGSFLAVPLLWNYVFKKRQLFSKTSVGRTALFIGPYVVVAAFLMYYNYARFGNIFDFGANYNLTTMDMVSEKFNFGKIPLGFYTYFIQPPYFIATFPFLKNVDVVKDFMGNYVMEQMYGGLLFSHIFLFVTIFAYKARDILKEKKLWITYILLVAFTFIIAIVDYNTGGIVHRYFIDFIWLIFIAAAVSAYGLYEKYSKTDFKNLFEKFISVAFVWSLFYNFALLFNDGTANIKTNIPQLYYFFERMIEFWI